MSFIIQKGIKEEFVHLRLSGNSTGGLNYAMIFSNILKSVTSLLKSTKYGQIATIASRNTTYPSGSIGYGHYRLFMSHIQRAPMDLNT